MKTDLKFTFSEITSRDHKEMPRLPSRLIAFWCTITVTKKRSYFSDHCQQPMALTAFDDDFFAATRINSESTSLAVTACVVEPALVECQTMGFASFVLLTVDYLFICNLVGRTILTVIWRNCFSGCSQDPNLNSWEWYFEPINQGIEAKARKVVCPINSGAKNLSEVEPALRPIIDSSFRNRSCLRQFADTGLITVQERLRVNKWIQQYFKPNKNIINGVDDFYRRHLAGNTLLGVHVRGTDRWGELPGGKLASLSDWVTQAALLYDSLQKPKKIFIASDNEEAIVAFLGHFGRDKVSPLIKQGLKLTKKSSRNFATRYEKK